MEVIRWSHHVAFDMDDTSRVGEARRHAAETAHAMRMGEVQAGKVALIVTELGGNLVRHASGGQLLIASRGGREIEIVAIDRGPGMADLGRSMDDGFSTGGTPGTGLGAVRRLACGFEVHTAVPQGTALVARVTSDGAGHPKGMRMHVGGVCVPVRTETVSGDAWMAAIAGDVASLLVVDGLGHGADAAAAAEAALDAFAMEPMAEPRGVIERVHARLRSTRGAAVLALQLDAQRSLVQFCGAGNVVGRLVAGDADRTLLSQHGTAGVQVRKPEQASVPWPDHAVLVVHTDGVETRWLPELLYPVLRHDPSLAAALLYRNHRRGRDDATVVALRRDG